MKQLYFAIVLLLASNFAHATLLNGSTLNFSPLAVGGQSNTLPVDGSGSWFALDLGGGSFIIVPLTSLNGLVLGTTQLATSVPAVGNIDKPWTHFGNAGVHLTTSDTNVLSTTGDTATVDFSGWGVSWNDVFIDMSSNEWVGDGIADVVCESGSGCEDGANYMLDYSASNFLPHAQMTYILHLEGTISAVPVPAAVWLFGSGLIGLVGFSSRRIKKPNLQ